MKIGWYHAIVREQPDVIKTYLVRWKGAKVDLTKLAKLRWIENMSIPDLCNRFGKRRTAISQHLRTIRKCAVSQLNLTEDEKKIIEAQIGREKRRS